jgi:2-dehydro-3-deoxyphosphogluconate aldolase/(4S)-4-hydroxy-2-oxoglutarate aldolase
MHKNQVRERILEIGIVPVVRASSPKEALLAVEAVCAGGIPIVEITMTVAGALDVIRQVVRDRGTRTLVGAGTVLDAASARQCLEAGAEFLVSPGLDLKTVALARQEKKLMMPGALTPTEIMAATKAAADFVKIFPCGNLGGPKYIRVLRGPFPNVPMIPTGGVNLATAEEFIHAGAVALGVGGELVQKEALREGKPEIIAETARRFREAVARGRRSQTETAEAAG